MYSIKTAELEHRMTSSVRSGVETWTDVAISHVPLLDLGSLLTDQVPIALLDCELSKGRG